jgi:hypothetical protein
VHELGALEQGRQHGSQGTVELVRALRSAGEIDDGLGRVEAQEPAAVLARAAGQLRPERVAGEHGALGRDVAAAEREGQRHASGKARGHAVGEAGHGRLLVHDHGDAEHARGQRGRKGDEAPGGEEQAGLESPQEAPGLGKAGGNPQAQVGHVLPVPVAAELAGGDGVKGQARFGGAARLQAAAAADPVHLHSALHQGRGHREARARMPPRAAARDDDAHPPRIIRRAGALRGAAARRRAHLGRSPASAGAPPRARSATSRQATPRPTRAAAQPLDAADDGSPQRVRRADHRHIRPAPRHRAMGRAGQQRPDDHDHQRRAGSAAQQRGGRHRRRGDRAKPAGEPEPEQAQAGHGASMLEQLEHEHLVARDGAEPRGEDGKRPHARRPGVGERIPDEVSERAEQEREEYRRPCRGGQRGRGEAAGGEPIAHRRRQERHHRRLDEEMEDQVGRETDGEDEPGQAGEAVTLRAPHPEGKEIGEVGRHAADHERGEDGAGAQQPPQWARPRRHGRG